MELFKKHKVPDPSSLGPTIIFDRNQSEWMTIKTPDDACEVSVALGVAFTKGKTPATITWFNVDKYLLDDELRELRVLDMLESLSLETLESIRRQKQLVTYAQLRVVIDLM